jgi:D-lactate dehydrogenase
MKVVAYSIKAFEKEFLAKANQKKHDITLISNPLSLATVAYAEGKDAVVVFTNDDVSAPVVNKLADMGIRFIATRSTGIDQIDQEAAMMRGIKLANVPEYSPQAIAEHTVALALALNRQLIASNQHSHLFDFRLNGLIGFNLQGKTVGLIGCGHIGQAVANIFNGFGCKVIAHDPFVKTTLQGIEIVPFDELLTQADIISLHAPLTSENHHLINSVTIGLMKTGVMLLNTSRGALIDTEAALNALQTGKIGYLGLDVYENERGLFFEQHQNDTDKDELLEKLMTFKNVLITPHQAFLTNEALQQIANQTIKNLDLWQEKKCVGDACACAKNCRAVVATPVTINTVKA